MAQMYRSTAVFNDVFAPPAGAMLSCQAKLVQFWLKRLKCIVLPDDPRRLTLYTLMLIIHLGLIFYESILKASNVSIRSNKGKSGKPRCPHCVSNAS